jgi:hypothetical protein
VRGPSFWTGAAALMGRRMAVCSSPVDTALARKIDTRSRTGGLKESRLKSMDIKYG